VTLLALAELSRGLVPTDEPVVFADDEGLLRGRAVFETLRVYGGRPFRLRAHLDRLTASAERLRLAPPPGAELAAAAGQAIAAGGAPDAVLRLLWTAGREGARRPVGLVLVSTLPADLEERRRRGLRLKVTTWATGALAGAKSTSYAENMTAQDDALRAGADDALFVAPDGAVLEAPTANVWFREGRTLHTPALSLPLLAGVTRAALCDLAPALGYTVQEGRYDLARLLAADEVFLSSSVREVMPVVSVDRTPIELGGAARELQAALRQAAAGYADADG
jgi:branched-subunit amino acid aminotransferase/4-amino-4-deoxychorismate lyase